MRVCGCVRNTYRRLGSGEAEVIILAKQSFANWAIIDESLGRKAARENSLQEIN